MVVVGSSLVAVALWFVVQYCCARGHVHILFSLHTQEATQMEVAYHLISDCLVCYQFYDVCSNIVDELCVEEA